MPKGCISAAEPEHLQRRSCELTRLQTGALQGDQQRLATARLAQIMVLTPSLQAASETGCTGLTALQQWH